MSIIFSQFTIDLYEEVIFLWNQCDGIGLSDADSRGSIKAYLDINVISKTIEQADKLYA
jgi:hypothetical protein